MLTLLAALFVATACAPLLIRTLGRPAFAVLATVPLGGFVWVVSLFQRCLLYTSPSPRD